MRLIIDFNKVIVHTGMNKLTIKADKDITIKIPIDLYEDTLHFYRDILLMETEEVLIDLPSTINSTKVKFGDINLWLEPISNPKDAAMLLKINTNQMENALNYLQANNVKIIGKKNKLIGGYLRIQDPAGNTLLLTSNFIE